MPQGRRPIRLANQLKEELSLMIQFKLKDPRIGFITLTRVELTVDLRLATVYFSIMGDESQRRHSLEGLEKAAGFMRHELKKTLQLRFIPELRFRIDDRWDAQSRMEELLDQIQRPAEPEKGSTESLSSDISEKEEEEIHGSE
jgi:ribosome-binding factor A